MVDTLVLGTNAERRVSSSLTIRTTEFEQIFMGKYKTLSITVNALDRSELRRLRKRFKRDNVPFYSGGSGKQLDFLVPVEIYDEYKERVVNELDAAFKKS